MRDDFPISVQRQTAGRVAHRCSICHAFTSAPQKDSDKSVNLGVAAHITAAAKGGPRYNPSLTEQQRKSGDNGIWLCQTCAKWIDSDVARFPVTLLRDLKMQAENEALLQVGVARQHLKDVPKPARLDVGDDLDNSSHFADDVVFPEGLIDTVTRSMFHVIEAGDIQSNEDMEALIRLMYDEPEHSYYLFQEKGASPQNELYRGAGIRADEMEFHFYRHPHFQRDYVRIMPPNGEYTFAWEREVVEKGPMFTRTTLRLMEKKRRELEVMERIETEKRLR